jgi:plastocyanin
MARPEARRTPAAAAVTLAAVAFLALLPPHAARGGPRPVPSFEVVADGGPQPFTWEWTPADLTIRSRGKVTWLNPTEAVHHVTFWDGPGAKHQHLHPGGSATLTLRKPGVYSYWCDIFGHADIVTVGPERFCVGMCGTITVE